MRLEWMDRVTAFIDRCAWPAIVFAALYYGWQVLLRG